MKNFVIKNIRKTKTDLVFKKNTEIGDFYDLKNNYKGTYPLNRFDI